MSNRRCCARCKTPYNCGNPVCACHPVSTRDRAEWSRVFREAEEIPYRFQVDGQFADRSAIGRPPKPKPKL